MVVFEQMNTTKVVDVRSIADEIERLQQDDPNVHVGKRITHAVHKHFGYDDTKQDVPVEVVLDGLQLVRIIRKELELRKKSRKIRKYGKKINRTPDYQIRQCQRGCYID